MRSCNYRYEVLRGGAAVSIGALRGTVGTFTALSPPQGVLFDEMLDPCFSQFVVDIPLPPLCTLESTQGIAYYGVAGCMIAGNDLGLYPAIP